MLKTWNLDNIQDFKIYVKKRNLHKIQHFQDFNISIYMFFKISRFQYFNIEHLQRTKVEKISTSPIGAPSRFQDFKVEDC